MLSKIEPSESFLASIDDDVSHVGYSRTVFFSSMSNPFDRPNKPTHPVEAESIRTGTLSIQEISNFVSSHFSAATAVLFGGDRLSCCDEGVGIHLDGKLVGIATIAPRGEQDSGVPTIVGVYVDKAARQNRLGRQLFIATVQRCQERGFTRIHVDSMSVGMMKIIDSLPAEMRNLLDVQDCGDILAS